MNRQNNIRKNAAAIHPPVLPKGVKIVKGKQNPVLRKWINDRDVTTSGGCHTVHRQYA